MKLIVGYDGSECARAATVDLAHAGLPQETHVVVVTAAESWAGAELMPYAPLIGGAGSAGGALDGAARQGDTETSARAALELARHLAQEGAARVRWQYPQWSVDWEASLAAPAQTIVTAANEHDADLIIVGSRGRSALRRLFAGSVSREVLLSARCSVRAVHEHAQHAGGPQRAAALDPSELSQAVIRSLGQRHWPTGTALCLLTVGTRHHVLAGGADLPRLSWRGEPEEAAVEQLRGAGCAVQQVARHGDPARLILAEAREWGADCILISPRAFGVSGRANVGAVPSEVFAAAPCDVEVVRNRGPAQTS